MLVGLCTPCIPQQHLAAGWERSRGWFRLSSKLGLAGGDAQADQCMKSVWSQTTCWSSSCPHHSSPACGGSPQLPGMLLPSPSPSLVEQCSLPSTARFYVRGSRQTPGEQRGFQAQTGSQGVIFMAGIKPCDVLRREWCQGKIKGAPLCPLPLALFEGWLFDL